MPTNEEEARLKKASDEALDEVTRLQEELRQANERWRVAREEYQECLKKRTPTESELVYAYAKCDCGAHMAYRRAADAGAWDCADILLGRAIPAGQPGSVKHSAVMPFSFWKVKEDRTRTTPRDD